MRPTLLYSIIYFFVAFPLTPKYVTLNHEWPFLMNFTFFHAQVQDLLIYLYGQRRDDIYTDEE